MIRRDPNYRPAWPPNPPTPQRRPPPPPRPPRQQQPPPRPQQPPPRPPAPPTGEKVTPQTSLGPHPAGVPARLRRRGGGHGWLDGLVAAPHPRAGRLPRASRRGQGHHLASRGVRQPSAPDPRTAGRAGHRRGHRRRPHRHHPAGACPGLRLQHADHDGVHPARLVRADSRLRQRQDQRGVLRRRRPAAGADRRTGHRPAARPLRRDRVRRIRRPGRRRRRSDHVSHRTDQRSAGRHRPARRLPEARRPQRRSGTSAPAPPRGPTWIE